MNTISNPTKEEVIEFCRKLEDQLLAALDRGSVVTIGCKQHTKDITNPGYGYGNMVIDVIYIGAKFVAEFRERGY